MADVLAGQHRKIGSAFTGRKWNEKLTYNFANDAGATADSIQLCTMEAACIITSAKVHVSTACTSSGSATVIIGVNGGDTNAVLESTAVAALVDNATFEETAGQILHVASGGQLELTIATAALTAGVISVYVEGYTVD